MWCKLSFVVWSLWHEHDCEVWLNSATFCKILQYSEKIVCSRKTAYFVSAILTQFCSIYHLVKQLALFCDRLWVYSSDWVDSSRNGNTGCWRHNWCRWNMRRSHRWVQHSVYAMCPDDNYKNRYGKDKNTPSKLVSDVIVKTSTRCQSRICDVAVKFLCHHQWRCRRWNIA